MAFLFFYGGLAMPSVKVMLREDEREALEILAEHERRDPRAQAALLIRRELERQGYIRPLTVKPVEGIAHASV
jgi:hypothetical protein